MADILTPTLDAIKNMREEATQAMNRLENVASLPYLSWFDFAELEGFDPDQPDKLEFSALLPKLEKVSVPGLESLDRADLDRYKQHVWSPTNLNTLQTTIMAWIEDGGVGISQATQDAIFGQGRERDLQILRDRMDIAGARTGARGFRYATSMTRTLQNQALAEYDHKRSDLNREVVRLMADLAQKNVQFAFEKDIAIESLHADFAIRYGAMFLDINKSILDRFRIEQETRVTEFEGELKRLDMDVQLQIRQAGLDTDHQQRLMDAWKTTASLRLERGKANIAQAEEASKVKLTAATTLATVYADSIKSLTGSAVSLDIKKPT